MKRWEKFNKQFDENKSLEEQAKEMVEAKIQEEPNKAHKRDIYYVAYENWLDEEVEW